jgi:hypothetical protein
MEVPVSVGSKCGKFVWRGHSCPRTVCSKMAVRVSTDVLSNLGHMQRALHIRCHHSIHLDV